MLSDVHLLDSSGNTYTYVSASHGTCSWLDHCLCSPSLHSAIQSISVNYANCSSDHLPLVAEFMLNSASYTSHERVLPSHPKFCWSSVTVQQVTIYNESVRHELRSLMSSALTSLGSDCAGHCEDASHLDDLFYCYKAFTETVTSCGARCFQHTGNFNNLSARFVPGWNESVRLRHDAAHRAFLHWRACGSPKEGYPASGAARGGTGGTCPPNSMSGGPIGPAL